MKLNKIIIVTILLTVCIAGCASTKAINGAVENHSVSPTTEVVTPSESPGVIPEVTPAPTSTSVPVDQKKINEYINQLKSKLKIGISHDEVVKLFGQNYYKVGVGDGPLSYCYRYDILSENGYNFNIPFDDVDIKGIINRKVNIVFFAMFSAQDKVDTYVIYYLNPENNNVFEYRLNNDGKAKTSEINTVNMW
jgi:hypothetical protein